MWQESEWTEPHPVQPLAHSNFEPHSQIWIYSIHVISHSKYGGELLCRWHRSTMSYALYLNIVFTYSFLLLRPTFETKWYSTVWSELTTNRICLVEMALWCQPVMIWIPHPVWGLLLTTRIPLWSQFTHLAKTIYGMIMHRVPNRSHLKLVSCSVL